MSSLAKISVSIADLAGILFSCGWATLISSIALFFLSFTTHAQEIKLMSFNIGSSDWVGNRDSVIARININDPDVFCAIEATRNTRPFIESSLTDYNMLQTFGNNPDLSESHIFYRKNMFSIIESGFEEMETYGGYNGPGRYVNWARLEETSSQNQFLVYASHFVFVLPTNPDSSTIGQYRHADGMVQLMNQHTSLSIPMITVGDFNAVRSSAVMQFLIDQMPITYNSTTITNPILLNDSWEVANPSVQKPGTVGSGSTAIDWILTAPNTNVTSAIIDNQGRNANGSFPSDHRPLVITFNPSLTTSIDDLSKNSGLLVFPNPFENHAQFEIELQNPERILVQIYDTQGRLVKSKEFEEYGVGKFQFTMDLSNLSNGIFLCRILTAEQLKTGLIIKRKIR